MREPPHAPALDLNAPLPPAMSSLHAGFGGYGAYPVFTWPWLRRRTLFIGAIAMALGLVIALALALSYQKGGGSVGAAVHFVLGIVAIASGGPLLATIVRTRRLAPRREGTAIVVAWLLGIVVSAVVDDWASRAIERVIVAEPSPMPKERSAVADLAFALAFYGSVGGGLAVRRYFREQQRLVALTHERELGERDLRTRGLDTRLRLLQAQIEPHFLFNTLASVRSLIESDPARACETVDALADYLRATIPRLRRDGASTESTVGEQIDLCERYLSLMQVRMGTRLSYTVDVEDDLRAAIFPPLVILTLVENAIRHGVEPKDGPARVSVRVARSAVLGRGAADAPAPRLELVVSDDGVGLREGFGFGVGLANLGDSLRVRYGEDASFDLRGASTRGTVATVTVPLQTERASSKP